MINPCPTLSILVILTLNCLLVNDLAWASNTKVPILVRETSTRKIPSTQINGQNNPLAFWFKLPSRGAPTGRRSAGKRNNCPKMTALVPEYPQKGVLGLTVSERPTFWFALDFPSNSESASNNLKFQFFLVDTDTGEDLMKRDVSMPEKSGIVGISLKEPVLAIGKSYGWRLECTSASGNTQSVYGGVERVNLSPSVNKQLQTTKNERERIAIYAENGIWYETITALATLYQKSPNDQSLKADWMELLTSVALKEEAERPLLPLIQP
jgi:hypothetical protein